MNILTINCGSSSIKAQLFDMSKNECIKKASVEEIFSDATISFEGETKKISCFNHTDALHAIMDAFGDIPVDAIGHRVVHGGEFFSEPTKITDDVLAKVIECNDLAPLHNPANIEGIHACEALFKDIPQVGVFDTAFHQTMPKKAYIYPIPYTYYEKYKIRKYGFHGTSHKYIYQELQKIMPSAKNVITCHLGNGASICAIEDGKSINTSMGFTPLAGVMMGTRSGDIDPAIIAFLAQKEGKTAKEVDTILNKESGLLGISGIGSDCRLIEEAAENGNERAKLSLDKFALRIREYIGSYFTDLAGVDAICFTGGIGEKGKHLRVKILENLGHLGIEIDSEKNLSNEQVISTKESKVSVLIIPTNEELMIAKETAELLK